MARKLDELMAMADVYAEALLEAAGTRQRKEEVAREFAEFVAHMDKDRAFGQFILAETVDADARRDSLDKLFRGRMNDTLLTFLQVLNRRDRLGAVRMIHRNVELRMEAEHHQQEVVVETALPLSDELRALMKERISAHLGKEALLIEKVEPALLGGVVIHIDDVQIDATVASRLRELRKRLRDRAVQTIHDKVGVEE